MNISNLNKAFLLLALAASGTAVAAESEVSDSDRIAQYREMAAFSQFAGDLDKTTLALLNRGARLMEAFKQGPQMPIPVAKQVVFLYACNTGLCDDIPAKQVGPFEQQLYLALDGPYAAFREKLEKSGDMTTDLKAELDQILAEFKKTFQPI